MFSFAELLCPVCHQSFRRNASEIKRSQRLGRPSYCSRACAGAANLESLGEHADSTKYLRRAGGGSDLYSPICTPFRIARNRARLNGEVFTITLDDLVALWQKQGGVCPYTGWKMILPANSLEYNETGKKAPQNTSLDRIDSAGGYTPDNVQFVCFMANCAKTAFSHDDMLQFCHAIARRHPAGNEMAEYAPARRLNLRAGASSFTTRLQHWCGGGPFKFWMRTAVCLPPGHALGYNTLF